MIYKIIYLITYHSLLMNSEEYIVYSNPIEGYEEFKELGNRDSVSLSKIIFMQISENGKIQGYQMFAHLSESGNRVK